MAGICKPRHQRTLFGLWHRHVRGDQARLRSRPRRGVDLSLELPSGAIAAPDAGRCSCPTPAKRQRGSPRCRCCASTRRPSPASPGGAGVAIPAAGGLRRCGRRVGVVPSCRGPGAALGSGPVATAPAAAACGDRAGGRWEPTGCGADPVRAERGPGAGPRPRSTGVGGTPRCLGTPRARPVPRPARGSARPAGRPASGPSPRYGESQRQLPKGPGHLACSGPGARQRPETAGWGRWHPARPCPGPQRARRRHLPRHPPPDRPLSLWRSRRPIRQ